MTQKAPVVALTAVKRSLQTVEKAKGFLVTVRCDVACTVGAKVKVGTRTVGSGTGPERIHGRGSVLFTVVVTAKPASGPASTSMPRLRAKAALRQRRAGVAVARA